MGPWFLSRLPGLPAAASVFAFRVAKFVGLVLPSCRPVAWGVLAATVAEALLIRLGQPNLYEADWPTRFFGLAYLCWFWLTVGWVVELGGRRWRCGSQGRSWLGIAGSALFVATLLTVTTLTYAVSWGLFLRCGRFANLETGRFVVHNVPQLWDYLLAAEPRQLAVGVILLVATATCCPVLLWWSVADCRRNPCFRGPMAAKCWFVLTAFVYLAWTMLPEEPSDLRRAVRLHALKHGLNPTFTLYVSHVEASLKGTVSPELLTHRLTPINSDQQRAPDSTGAIKHLVSRADRNPSGSREITFDSEVGERPSSTPPPSIVFVAIESLRHDAIYQIHQGREVLPHINRLARQGVRFTRAFAQSTHSDYADPCLVSSLYPLRGLRHHYYATGDPWPVVRIYDVLRPQGYATAIISSQNEAWGGMDHFLRSPDLDLFYHPETGQAATLVSGRDPGFSREVRLGGLVAGKFPDSHTADRAIDWMRQQAAAGRPFFLSMNLQSSHFPYLLPEQVGHPFQPCEIPAEVSFVDYATEYTPVVRNAYLNAIHECDRQVGRLVVELERLSLLHNTVLVVTGENGEAFHEWGTVTHAREPVPPAIHVACVMHAPDSLSARDESYPLEHVDLVPTVLKLAGLPTHPNFQGQDVFDSNRVPAEEKLTFCHVLSSFAEVDSVMLGGRYQFTHDRRSGRGCLFDLDAGDDAERDLAAIDVPLTERLRQALAFWRQQQLAYYHYPAYYLTYYPPPPPTWSEMAKSGESQPTPP